MGNLKTLIGNCLYFRKHSVKMYITLGTPQFSNQKGWRLFYFSKAYFLLCRYYDYIKANKACNIWENRHNNNLRVVLGMSWVVPGAGCELRSPKYKSYLSWIRTYFWVHQWVPTIFGTFQTIHTFLLWTHSFSKSVSFKTIQPRTQHCKVNIKMKWNKILLHSELL